MAVDGLLVNLNQLGARPVLPLYHPTDYVECTGRTFAELADVAERPVAGMLTGSAKISG